MSFSWYWSSSQVQLSNVKKLTNPKLVLMFICISTCTFTSYLVDGFLMQAAASFTYYLLAWNLVLASLSDWQGMTFGVTTYSIGYGCVQIVWVKVSFTCFAVLLWWYLKMHWPRNQDLIFAWKKSGIVSLLGFARDHLTRE